MDYQNSSRGQRGLPAQAGFSIVELLVVIGIFVLFAIVSDSLYGTFKSHSSLEIATSSLVEAARHAQSNAQFSKADASWGIEISPNTLVIFKGQTYAARDTGSDQSLSFPAGVSASGASEFVFAKVSGLTSVGTTTLTNTYGSKDIFINAKGTITY